MWDEVTTSSPQERLLQFVSLSASGLDSELKQPESAAREALTRAVFSIADQDPEFILKVILSSNYLQTDENTLTGRTVLPSRTWSETCGKPVACLGLSSPGNHQASCQVSPSASHLLFLDRLFLKGTLAPRSVFHPIGWQWQVSATARSRASSREACRPPCAES